MTRILSVIALLATVLSDSTLSQTARATGPATTTVLRPNAGNKRQFDRQLKTLPDSTVVESEGRRLTVGEIKAKTAELYKASVDDAREGAKASTARFGERQSQYTQRRMARLNAENEKIKVELGKLSRFEAIRAEAARMMERTKTATPAELKELDARASQLLRELNTLATVVK